MLEIFLLLIFATFIYFSKLSDTIGGEGDNLSIRVKALLAKLDEAEKENRRLNQRVTEAEQRIKELEEILEALRNMTNSNKPPKKPGALGYPPCAKDNTLLKVEAHEGQINAVVIADEAALFAHVKETTGIELRQDGVVTIEHDELFHAILEYSKAHKCRYAYDMTWSMPQDYILRERLERYLYPGKLVKESVPRG